MNIMDNLLQDHEQIMIVVNQISQKLPNLPTLDQFEEFDLLLNRVHEPKEEEVFVSVIPLASTKDSEDLLKGMIGDHQTIREQTKAILDALSSNTQDSSTAALIDQLFQDLTKHIKLENEIYYPLAQKYITEDISQKIFDKYQSSPFTKM